MPLHSMYLSVHYRNATATTDLKTFFYTVFTNLHTQKIIERKKEKIVKVMISYVVLLCAKLCLDNSDYLIICLRWTILNINM